MRRELKYLKMYWNESFETLSIENSTGEVVILRRADIFPLMRFCLRIIQRYFVSGIKTVRRRAEKKLLDEA